MKYYDLRLTEKQMKVLKDACELRFRIDLLQGGELAEILSTIDCLDLRNDNPRHKEIFDSYIERRDHIRAVIDALFEIASPFSFRMSGHRKRDPDSLVCEDIWQVIRKCLYDERPAEQKTEWNVDGREPLQVSDQPLPTVRSVTDGD